MSPTASSYIFKQIILLSNSLLFVFQKKLLVNLYAFTSLYLFVSLLLPIFFSLFLNLTLQNLKSNANLFWFRLVLLVLN